MRRETVIYNFHGLNRTSRRFRKGIVDVARNLHTDPNFLLAVMQKESGFRADAHNPNGGASGLIQWMPSTLAQYGLTGAQMRALKDYEQLPYVYRFFSHYKKHLTSAGNVYMCTFLPLYVTKGDSFVLGRKNDLDGLPHGQTYHTIYIYNSVFDRTGKGYFDCGDVRRSAEDTLWVAKERGPWPGDIVERAEEVMARWYRSAVR